MIKEIDYGGYVYGGNKQGCDNVLTFSYRNFPDYDDSGNPGKFPRYPTKVNTITKTAPADIKKGQTIKLDVSGMHLWDCTDWRDIQSYNRAIGAFAQSSPGTKETKTFLVSQPKPTPKTYDGMVTQNFAFDIDLEDYT